MLRFTDIHGSATTAAISRRTNFRREEGRTGYMVEGRGGRGAGRYRRDMREDGARGESGGKLGERRKFMTEEKIK